MIYKRKAAYAEKTFESQNISFTIRDSAYIMSSIYFDMKIEEEIS